MKRSAWHLRVGAVVASWLVAVLAVAIVALLHPVAPWLLVHLLLLGAVSNAVLIWGRHFADALLRLPVEGRRHGEAMRLVSFNVGALVVVVGMSLDAMVAVVAGAVVVASVVIWHAVALLHRMRRALPSRFGSTLRYYVAASALLPVGLTFGVLMAPDSLDEEVHARFALAHVAVNLLGWIGLTVLGTLVTLWPTMLHSRVAEGAERASRRALPVLLAGIAITGLAAVAGGRGGAAAGLLCYLLGIAVTARPLFVEACLRPPSTFATRSVLAALLWLAGSVAVLAIILVVSSTWERAADAADWLAAPFLVGFVAQVLLGALSYLGPVVMGGGPAATRASNATFDTAGRVRLTALNLATLAAAVPTWQAGRPLFAVAVLAALASFLWLAVRATLIRRAMSPIGAVPPTGR